MEPPEGLERFMFIVEEKLNNAADVNTCFELIIIRGSRLIPAESREEFKRNLRIVLQPLVDLELKRRVDKGVVEDDFWDGD